MKGDDAALASPPQSEARLLAAYASDPEAARADLWRIPVALLRGHAPAHLPKGDSVWVKKPDRSAFWPTGTGSDTGVAVAFDARSLI